MKKKILIGLSLVLVVTFFVNASRSDVFFEIKKNFAIFSDVFSEVSLRYVDEVDPGKLVKTAINAMLEILDPYTVLIDENRNQEIDIITTGKYAGVGLEIGIQRGEVVVIAPVEGYSADKKGIKAGDIIQKLNGLSIKDLSEEEIEAQLFGEAGSAISLTIKRFGIDKPLEFNLIRERIDVKSVPFAGFLDKEKGVAFIQLRQFSQQCATEVRTALTELNTQKEIKSLVFDLRNNPGGLLDEAVSILDLFLPAGVEVVRIKGRMQEGNQVFFTREPALFPNVKLIILQNNGSASASEIVAGALQDLDRAIIVGERSYGKGLVQTIRPIAYNNALKITSSRYYIPSGRSIQSLKYSHLERNEVSNVPDSLRQAFKTKNGRTVYDGIGIEPDIKLVERTPDLLEIALLKDSYYFYFANEYVSNHTGITEEEIKSSVFSSFKTYLEKQKFSFETTKDQSLALLAEELQDVKESEVAIKQLHEILEQQKVKRFEELAPFIQGQLFVELITRFKEKKESYPILLKKDDWTTKAVSLLLDQTKYDKYIHPQK